MAIYHFSGSIISRSQGRSAVAAAAYRSGTDLIDERYGVIYNYSKKEDIVFSAIYLPENAPQTFTNRQVLWNAVEHAEKRKDAQLAREFTLSLPRELSLEQNKALLVDFVKNEFVSLGMIADVNFHNDLMKNGERQPHAHVMLTLREVNQDGFGKKVRAWNDKAKLVAWREAWANSVNHQLAKYGHDLQIDHRSFKEQGIVLEPQHKIGPTIAQNRLARLKDHQRIAKENGNLIFKNPTIALDALTRQQSTFTYEDLARFINRHTDNAEQFQAVFEKVKTSPALVFLGLDEKKNNRFSTHDMLTLESSLMHQAQVLNKRLAHRIDTHDKTKAIASRHLTAEQETVLHYLTAPGDLKSVVGYAGTGKSYVLGAAREVWEASGYQVLGTTLSGIAAENLKDSSGIQSRTIASLLYRLDKGMMSLTSKNILVVDEAGMLGSLTMARLVDEVAKAKAKLVLVGDWQQLQAIEAGAAFRAVAKHHNYVELNQIRRQSTPCQIQASRDLALGHVGDALKAYHQHDHLHRATTQTQAMKELITLWNDARIAHPSDSQIILTFTKKEVHALNELARTQKRIDGELGKDHLFQTERGERQFSINDRVYFLKREDSLSVVNGTLGTIRTIDAKSGVIGVELDKDDLKQKPNVVFVNTSLYKHLEHGYAATVYKAQGITVDRAYILPTKYDDAHSTYVALTRHRKSVDVFISEATFPNDKALIDRLSQNRAKDITLDYTKIKNEFTRQRDIAPEKAASLSYQERIDTIREIIHATDDQLLDKYLAKRAQQLSTKTDARIITNEITKANSSQQVFITLALNYWSTPKPHISFHFS